MAKNEKLTNDAYVVEEVKESRLRNWMGTRAAKVTAISVGSALAIGAAFTGGVVAAKTVLPHQDGPGFAEGFDRDGDHRPPADGQRPPKPGDDDGGDGDGDRGGQFQVAPNQTSSPAPSTTTP